MLARVKLKESDCGFTTAWAMGLNSIVREQPYLGLALVMEGFSFKGSLQPDYQGYGDQPVPLTHRCCMAVFQLVP